MKYVFILVFGLIAVFLLSCCSFRPKDNSQAEDYEKLADIITDKTAQKLRVEKRLHLIGTGGRMMDDIKMMYMGFEFFHPIDVSVGRELLVFSIQEYLAAINSDEKIRCYLHEYPFTVKNVKIGVWIRNPDGSQVSVDKIDYISAIDGVLRYHLDDPEKYSSKIVHEETYEEALKAISLDKRIEN